MIGALAFIAISWIFTIFCAWVSESEPPNTVKSLANTKVLRPLTVPQPVTTPSPGTLVFSMPNSVERCSTNMSNSSKEPLSSSSSIRSRAVSLPRACCASIRFSPPPSLALARRSARMSKISFIYFRPYWPWIWTGSNTAFSEPETGFPPEKVTRLLGTKRTIAGEFGGAHNERDSGNGDHGHRHRRGANAAPAGGADAACGNDAALCPLGRIVVAVRPPVPGARSELCGRPRGPPDWRYRLQRRTQLPGADGADDGRVCACLSACACCRDDLARAYRLRSRARLRPEIPSRIWLYPSRPYWRQGDDLVGSDRADIGKAGLRKLHAIGDMARLAYIEVERKHRLRIALLGPTDQPAQRRLAALRAHDAGFGADNRIARTRDRQDIAHQLLSAFRDRKRAAPQAIEEIDLLKRIDPQVTGQPELVDAAANVAVAVFEEIDILLPPFGADAPGNLLID